MRVLFLQRQPCIRARKYAIGLRALRPDIRLGFACQGDTLSGWYGTGDELFDQWWHLDADPRDGLRQVMSEFRPDVVHSHNLPDGLTVAALDVAGVPVIHDSHDMQSLRQTPYEDGLPEPAHPLELERRAIEGASALITVSDEMLDEIRARYRVPDQNGSSPTSRRSATFRRFCRHLALIAPARGGWSTRARCRRTAATTTSAAFSPHWWRPAWSWMSTRLGRHRPTRSWPTTCRGCASTTR